MSGPQHAPAKGCLRARRVDREAGTSMVEVIVATMLLAVGVVGVVGSIGAASEAAAAGRHRSEAARIAANELEAIRALSYGKVGIATADAGYVARFEGRPTVTEADNRVAPQGDASAGGITFDVRRHVTWGEIDVGGSLIADAYKHITVVVAWADPVGDHAVRLDSGIYEVAPGD